MTVDLTCRPQNCKTQACVITNCCRWPAAYVSQGTLEHRAVAATQDATLRRCAFCAKSALVPVNGTSRNLVPQSRTRCRSTQFTGSRSCSRHSHLIQRRLIIQKPRLPQSNYVLASVGSLVPGQSKVPDVPDVYVIDAYTMQMMLRFYTRINSVYTILLIVS